MATKPIWKHTAALTTLLISIAVPSVVSANSYHTVGMLVEDCNSKDRATATGCSYYLQGISDAVMESWAVRKIPCEAELLAPTDAQKTIFARQGAVIANVLHTIMDMRKQVPVIDNEPAAKVVRLVIEGYCPTQIPPPK